MRRISGWIALCVAGTACNGEDPATEPACLDGTLDLDCQPLFPPTYDRIFLNVLQPTCASAGVACHGTNGRKGGLVFEDQDEAFAMLLGQSGHPARVRPGEPECSKLLVKLESVGEEWQMPPPPSAPLNEDRRCAIRQWIADGALRNP
jgi:hypothetical protein